MLRDVRVSSGPPNYARHTRKPRYGFVWLANFHPLSDSMLSGFFYLQDMWFVYVLNSLVTDFIYIGSTNNVERRLGEHNAGEVQSTKAFAPFELKAYVAVLTERDARRLERYFKTGSGKAVLYKRILGMDPRN